MASPPPGSNPCAVQRFRAALRHCLPVRRPRRRGPDEPHPVDARPPEARATEARTPGAASAGRYNDAMQSETRAPASGRIESRADVAAPGPVDRLAALLDRRDPPAEPGAPLPPLFHWLYFLAADPPGALGPDGHPRRGGFLPADEALPRRMWAGGRIAFHHDVAIGAAIRRRSEVVAMKERQGRSGRLLLVTVRHVIGPAESEAAAIIEEHDIVYRTATAPAAAAPAAPETAAWRRSLMPDAVMLFRYSALTYNGHRIHYDRDWARAEGYPGLVVHGPLVATLLLDLLRRADPDRAIRRFTFRARSPAFDGDRLDLLADPGAGGGPARMWARGPDGRLVMEAEASPQAGPDAIEVGP
jgi:3-methylfumaryl-CoA hydratase